MESALLLVVPEAEPIVHEHRAQFERAARVGVPAHLTVIYPFEPVDALSADDLGRLRTVFRSAIRFTVELRTTGWFGDDVLFLVPENSAPIIDLTRQVEAAFPEYPIYGGQFEDIHPHLTIGHDCGAENLRRIQDVVTPTLPVTHQAIAIQLWSGPALATQRSGWQPVEAFPLGEWWRTRQADKGLSMMSPSDVVVALGSPPSAVTEQCVEHLAAARLSVDATMGNFPAQHAALSTTVRARFT